MTVIAAFSVDRCPVVFGDLLVSGPASSTKTIAVPAVGEVHDFFEGSGWSILGLQQKVTLINDRCMLAWSGGWLGAKVAIAELREIAEKTQLTTDGVRAFLSANSDVSRHNTSFVGWVHEESGNRFGQFRHDAEIINTDNFGRISFQGSGSDAIREFVELWKGREARATGKVNPAVSAIATGFSMSSMLLRAELHGGSSAPTLRAMFGGGYEIAAFFNGVFRKAGNLTFLIWRAHVTAEGIKLTLPELILKQSYFNDVLVLRSARVVSDGYSAPQLVDEQGHMILPMYEVHEKPTLRDIATLSFQSPLFCHCFLVSGSEPNDLMIYTKVQYTSSTSMPTVKIEDLEGRFVIGFHDDFLRETAKSLQEGMARRPKAS